MIVARARCALGSAGEGQTLCLMIGGDRHRLGRPVVRPPARPKGSDYVSLPSAPRRACYGRPVGRRLLLGGGAPARRSGGATCSRNADARSWRANRPGFRPARRVSCRVFKFIVGGRQIFIPYSPQMAHGPEVRALFDIDALIRRLLSAGHRCHHVEGHCCPGRRYRTRVVNPVSGRGTTWVRHVHNPCNSILVM